MAPTPRTWFITGTSSGFGLQMTRILLERGDRVVATVRKADALNELAERFPQHLNVAVLDVTHVDEVRRVVDAAFASVGRIDVVVNNAGYGLFGAAEEVTDEQIRHQIDTNLLGSIHVIRAALPHLRRQGGGRVIQVSSEGGQSTYPVFSVYHATKWGIEGFVEAVAQEVAPFGIEFTIAEPGASQTNFAAGVVQPEPIQAYEDSVVGYVRRAVMGGNLADFGSIGDPLKMAQAMIDSVDTQPAPKRLAMGKSTYARLRDVWTERLATLETYKDVTLSTDA
jgi:NAD(P)-dependent dehydrogenase (short-subunit alcohol dehydrogenase family)